MDPNNERKIFDLLLEIVANAEQSQFFYVTPKLIPELGWNRNLSCTVIFNGPLADRNDFFMEF